MPHCVRDLGHLSFHRGPEAHPTKCNARFFKAQKTQGTECCFCEIIAQRALYAVVSTLDLRWAEPWELGHSACWRSGEGRSVVRESTAKAVQDEA